MNANLPASHPSVDYYDSDYPGIGTTVHAENLDDVLERQGIAHDIDRYIELARSAQDPVLELCCGTGRIAIPLARAGVRVVGVDISAAMLERFRQKCDQETPDIRARLERVLQDVTKLELGGRTFPLAILSFNSLLLLTSRRDQQIALACAARHLQPCGRLAIDVVNPLALPLDGDPNPRPFFTRRHADRNRVYTRFAAMGPMDPHQCQRLYGWYDELDEQGRVLRTMYSMQWRPIFRSELELMLEACGLEIESVEGGHRGEPFATRSPRMFVVARRAT
jgi:ubiquinone/menaquinone biosynthesis C-methylase UbiE